MEHQTKVSMSYQVTDDGYSLPSYNCICGHTGYGFMSRRDAEISAEMHELDPSNKWTEKQVQNFVSNYYKGPVS